MPMCLKCASSADPDQMLLSKQFDLVYTVHLRLSIRIFIVNIIYKYLLDVQNGSCTIFMKWFINLKTVNEAVSPFLLKLYSSKSDRKYVCIVDVHFFFFILLQFPFMYFSFTTLCDDSADDNPMIFFSFYFRKQALIFKVSLLNTICMKYQSLFSG